MSKTPFMPLWVSDFLGDTLDLDAAEIGAYMLLLMAQWNRDGNSLPNDTKKLQRVARCGRNWAKVWGSIERYFDTDENGIYSIRLRLEAQNVAAKREVNAHNGALGGKAKALKTKKAPLANATETLQRKSSIPEPEPDIKEDTSVSSQKKRKSRIPENAIITDGMLRAATKRSLSQEEAEAQFSKFKNNALAKGLTYLDWDRGFITWLDSPYFKLITGGSYDNRNHNTGGSAPRPENRPDPAIERIARLAGLEEASGHGGS